MPARERLFDIGTQRGVRLVRQYAEEIRHARLAAGLSQVEVGAAAKVAGSTVSRIERGLTPLPDLVTAARVARIVGLDLSVKCFPAAGPLRDIAHVRLVQRFLEQLPQRVARRLEAPISLSGDQRAWDVLLVVEGRRIGVAAETRIRDLQALIRREQAKARDDGVDRLILVVAATRGNRAALRDAGPLLATDLPLDTRGVLRALRAGRAPTESGLVLC